MTIIGGWLKEGGEGEYFREGIYNDFEERFM
jgi:hypothetical protein